MKQTETPIRTQTGRFVDFEVYPNRLVIRLTEQGKEEVREWSEQEGRRNAVSAFFDLCEDQLGNGWQPVRPEQVGDLRDDTHLTFTDNFTYPSESSDDVMIVGTAYHFDRYAIDGYMEPIIRDGFVTFERHDYLTAEEFAAEVERLEKGAPDSVSVLEYVSLVKDAREKLRAGEAAEAQLAINVAAQYWRDMTPAQRRRTHQLLTA